MSKSIIQNEKVCFVTNDTHNLHKHHIFRGSKRNAAERYGCWVWLRADWHDMAPYGVHGSQGASLDLCLKQKCQAEFEKIHGHDKFMQVFGRNYL